MYRNFSEKVVASQSSDYFEIVETALSCFRSCRLLLRYKYSDFEVALLHLGYMQYYRFKWFQLEKNISFI